jgi:hypothetical protein
MGGMLICKFDRSLVGVRVQSDNEMEIVQLSKYYM